MGNLCPANTEREIDAKSEKEAVMLKFHRQLTTNAIVREKELFEA